MVSRFSLTVCLLVLVAAPASAWWEAGHMITGSIAFRRLTPEQRERVLAILRAHPRWSEDFEQKMPEVVRAGDAADHAEWFFLQATLWADLARDFPADEKARYNRPTWHYVDFPQFLADADRVALDGKIHENVSTTAPAEPANDLNIVQTIALARRVASDSNATLPDRALMLTWIFHTVGDSHQPLHSTALYSRGLFPEGCRGGNLVKIEQRKNLHALWDSLPGEKINLATSRNRALTLMNNSEMRERGEKAAQTLDGLAWLKEGHVLTASAVYTDEVLNELRAAEAAGKSTVPTIALSEAYLKAAGAVAEQRIVEAGYRLGAVLAEVVK
jgi:hypothetical protein